MVEHEDREMSTVKRLKDELEKIGCTCVILSTEFHAHLFNRFKVKNIVFPYAIDDSTWPIRAFKIEAFKYSNFITLNWEQLLSKANQDFKKPKSSFIQNHFYHLAWDESFKKFLENNNVKAEHIKVIGNPLHDLLLEDLNNTSVYEEKLRTEFKLKKNSDVYFFPMNYGWAFFSDNKIKAKIKMGYQPDIAYEYREYSQRCLNSFLYFITDLCNENSQNTFVVRPHPSISIEQYIERFKNQGLKLPDNLLLTKKYTIKEWIAISKVIGSSWSTSVWDAQKIGKIGFLYTPFKRPEWLETFWNPLVINISESNEFEKVLNSQNNEVSGVGEVVQSISSWLFDIHSGHSKEKIIKSGVSFEAMNYSYRIRAQLRVFSMEKLKGMGVGKGLQRDYFLPIK
nr:hypothetical protein [Marinomonas lutimaris]